MEDKIIRDTLLQCPIYHPDPIIAIARSHFSSFHAIVTRRQQHNYQSKV